jgi:hypothetical protein
MKIKPIKFSSLAAIAFITISVVSCSPPEEVEQATLISKMTVSNEDTTDGLPKTAGDAHGGKYFSHTDNANMYGCGTVYNLPDSLVQKTIRVKVNMWVRQGDSNPKNQFAVSLEAPDKTIIKWSEIDTQKHVAEMNKWVNVIDSVTIPGDMINKAGLILKMFAYNPEGTSYMDVDDVDISVYKVEKKIIE